MCEKITDNINEIILVLLALVTLREILIRFAIIPFHWKISKLLYNQYDKYSLLAAFKSLGIDEIRFKKHIVKVRNNYTKINNPEDRLVYFLSNYTYDYKTTYGINSPTQTNYFINTMEAAHVPSDLERMSHFIANLIDKKGGNVHQDFIITPKCGNPMLGQFYTSIYKNTLILAKYETDKSRSKSTDPLVSLMINFEGFASLRREAENNPDHDYYGYIIDCNQSGGSLILNPMIEFNRLLNELHKAGKLNNIKPLKDAFILFRADIEKTEFDKDFEDNGFSCYRYFDLKEEYKKSLFEFKSNKNTLICRCLTNKRVRFIEEFTKELRCKNLLFYN